MAQGYKNIARVVKTHGIKGEVVAVPAHGLPAVLSQGLNVCVVPPNLRGERWHEVLDVETSDAGQLVTLSGVTTTAEAHELVGKYLVAKFDDCELAQDYNELDVLIGLEVVDERLGSIGTVSEVMMGAVQDIAVVSCERGETMIPLVEDLIWYADDEQSLESAIPRGLAPWDILDTNEEDS